jgi:hypothetical protein
MDDLPLFLTILAPGLIATVVVAVLSRRLDRREDERRATRSEMREAA